MRILFRLGHPLNKLYLKCESMKHFDSRVFFLGKQTTSNFSYFQSTPLSAAISMARRLFENRLESLSYWGVFFLNTFVICIGKRLLMVVQTCLEMIFSPFFQQYIRGSYLISEGEASSWEKENKREVWVFFVLGKAKIRNIAKHFVNK